MALKRICDICGEDCTGLVPLLGSAVIDETGATVPDRREVPDLCGKVKCLNDAWRARVKQAKEEEKATSDSSVPTEPSGEVGPPAPEIDPDVSLPPRM